MAVSAIAMRAAFSLTMAWSGAARGSMRDMWFGAFRVNSPLMPRQGVGEPAGGKMDSNEIDPTWGTPSSDTPPDDIDPSWPPPVRRTTGGRFGHLTDI